NPPRPVGPGEPSRVTQLRNCDSLRTKRPRVASVSYQTSCHLPSTSIPITYLRVRGHDTVPVRPTGPRAKTTIRGARDRVKSHMRAGIARTHAALAVVAAVVALALLPGTLLAPTAARAAGDPRTINLTIASSHATSIAWVGLLHTLVVPEANARLAARGSPYRVRFTESYGGALYKLKDTLEAVEIGLT